MFHYRPAHSEIFHIFYVDLLCNYKRATGCYTVSEQEETSKRVTRHAGVAVKPSQRGGFGGLAGLLGWHVGYVG